MIEQRRAMLLANTNSASSSARPPNGTTSASTPRQAAAQAMRTEDAQMSRFLRLLQETRDDGQPGEAVFGPTVPTSLSRRELHRQGVGFADTAVAAVVSAAGDRFLASVLQQSIPCRDQRLTGLEKARQAARERKRFRQKFEQDIDQRKRRKLLEVTKKNAANHAAIENAKELDNKQNASNTAKRKADTESDANNDAAKQQTASVATNGVLHLQKIEASDIEYDSVDEEDKRYIDHYAAFDDNDDDLKPDDEDEEDEVLVLVDVARPLRAWGFHVDGKLTSDILASVAPPPVVANEHDAAVPDGGVENHANDSQQNANGQISEVIDGDNDAKGKPTSTGTPTTSKLGTPTKGGTPPKGVDSGNTAKTKSPST